VRAGVRAGVRACGLSIIPLGGVAFDLYGSHLLQLGHQFPALDLCRQPFPRGKLHFAQIWMLAYLF